jgi:hypothetical protein
MPSRRHCLIGGLLCITLAVAFGWFILEPFTEKVFLPSDHIPEQQQSDPSLQAKAGAVP